MSNNTTMLNMMVLVYSALTAFKYRVKTGEKFAQRVWYLDLREAIVNKHMKAEIYKLSYSISDLVGQGGFLQELTRSELM